MSEILTPYEIGIDYNTAKDVVNLFYEDVNEEDDKLLTKIANRIKEDYEKFKKEGSGADKYSFIDEWIENNTPDTKELKSWYERDEAREDYMDEASKDLDEDDKRDKEIVMREGARYLLQDFADAVLTDEE